MLALFVLTACGGDGSAEAAGGEGEAESRTTVATIFDESLEDDKCAIFTRQDASAATGVPLEEMEKRYPNSCLYSWNAGDDYPDGNLNLMSLAVHDNVKQARGYYTRFSGDVTAEEIAAGKEDWIHPAVGREVARLIVANLEEKS